MPIGVLFRETINHVLAVNVGTKILVGGVVTTVHAGDVTVVEDDRIQKLVLIGPTPAVGKQIPSK